MKSLNELLKIMFINFVVIIKDIRTDYDFCNWHYVTAKTWLLDKTTSEFICLNMRCLIILLNCTFFKSQHIKVKICTIIILILIWEISSDKHITSKYVIVSIYLAGTVKLN